LTKKGPGGWDKPAKLHNKPKEIMKKRKPKKQTQMVLSKRRDETDAEFAKLDTNKDNYVQIKELANMEGAFLRFIFIDICDEYSSSSNDVSLTERKFEEMYDEMVRANILSPNSLEDYSLSRSPEGQAKKAIDKRDTNGDRVLGPLELLPMGGNEFERLGRYVYGVWARDCQDGRINQECELVW
jgi:hypothetical protein